MRLDHCAYRVKDRVKTAQFFIDAFGYRIQEEFEIPFDDGSKAKCIALEPPEKVAGSLWQSEGLMILNDNVQSDINAIPVYHLAPEIFVSDGDPESIVGQWVASRGGIGGIHHLAYQVESVQAKMDEWKAKGYAEFTTDAPLTCEDESLVQVFTKPSSLTGVIYEFIERGAHGFCKANVKQLMESTKNIDQLQN